MAMLTGIRIIDLTTVIFGPYATQMLADLGADVIKVETPGIGDISRYLGSGVPDPTMGSIHLTVNRGKRSIALDLKKPEDAAVLRDLVAGADVFFHNVRGKAIAKLGFDYAGCKAIKDHIIYVHGTGFGQDGPYADLQAYDDVIQAATGTTSLLPRVDGDPRPRYFPSLIADKIAGQFGAQAILAALIAAVCGIAGYFRLFPRAFDLFTLYGRAKGTFNDPNVFGPFLILRHARSRPASPFRPATAIWPSIPYTPESTARLMRLLGSEGLTETPEFEAAKAAGKPMPIVYGEDRAQNPGANDGRMADAVRRQRHPRDGRA